MKKALSSTLAILLAFTFILQASLTSFADEASDWEDVSLSQSEFDDIISENSQNLQAEPLATDLIIDHSIAISKSGSNLLIAGYTRGNASVVKTGFKVVTIKRRASTSDSWSTYKTYNDLYNNSTLYTLQKTLSVPSGYQYKVLCTHYAKKNLFSTQKIENSSNVVTF